MSFYHDHINLNVITHCIDILSYFPRTSVTYASGQEGRTGRSKIELEETCALEDNERITTVTAYTRPYKAVQIVQALQLLTSQQTCGPYGTVSADIEVVSGHQLLYVTGRMGSLMDAIELHFDYGCTHT